MFLSGLCVLHCLFIPVVIALLPLWSAVGLLHVWLHPVLFLLITPSVYLALRSGDVPIKISGLLYGGLLVIGLAEIAHEELGVWGESVATTMGSLLLIAGHWFNYRRRHRGIDQSILKARNNYVG